LDKSTREIKEKIQKETHVLNQIVAREVRLEENESFVDKTKPLCFKYKPLFQSE